MTSDDRLFHFFRFTAARFISRGGVGTCEMKRKSTRCSTCHRLSSGRPRVLAARPDDGYHPGMEIKVTYLQMFTRPNRVVPPPREGLCVLYARRPPIPYYRFLYDAVGGPWQWLSKKK